MTQIKTTVKRRFKAGIKLLHKIDYSFIKQSIHCKYYIYDLIWNNFSSSDKLRNKYRIKKT